MTTALVSSGLGFAPRGIETWMLEVARTFHRLGYPVEIWSGGRLPADPALGQVRSLHGIGRTSRLWSRLTWTGQYLGEQWSTVLQAVLLARWRRPDLLYCGDPILAWNLKRFRRFHRARVVFMNGMRLTPRWLQDYDGIHLLAPAYLEEARQILPHRSTDHFFAIPHFVDTDLFRPAAEGEAQALRARRGLPAGAFLVLTVGPVGTASRKRLEHLASEIRQAGDAVHLVSVGGPEDGFDSVRSEVQRLLGSRVHFLGPVPRAEMSSVYRLADTYSLGSLAEPFSIAILEALASGLPVVHHADPVMTWQAGGGGVPVDMEADGAAAGVFRDLAGRVGRWRALAEGARALALDRYAAEPVARRLHAELSRIAGRP